MPAVDSSFVILPRFTSLVGATTFTSLAQDASSYGGAQFQVWRGPIRTKTSSPPAKFTIYLEESLDTETWVLGPGTPTPFEIAAFEVKFFSYSFRLRWFRVRVVVEGDDPIVTCWAEGLLRGGGSGVWPAPGGAPAGSGNLLDPTGRLSAVPTLWDVIKQRQDDVAKAGAWAGNASSAPGTRKS